MRPGRRESGIDVQRQLRALAVLGTGALRRGGGAVGLRPGGRERDARAALRAALGHGQRRQLCGVKAVGAAEAFLRANKNRKPLNGLAKFRAATTAEQPAALLVQQLITAVGRTASESSSGTTVRCLAPMMWHAERQPEVLRRVWPLIAEVCSGKPVHERILEGMLYIETHLPEGESLMDKEWRKRALRVSYDGLLGAASRFAAAYSKGGAKVWALGMVEAMNKGCRTHMKLAGEEEG